MRLTEEQRTNLAICEHMRWVAAHEFMGYGHYVQGECDARRRTHTDMVDYDSIGTHIRDHAEREIYRSEKQHYDSLVIEASYKTRTIDSNTKA